MMPMLPIAPAPGICLSASGYATGKDLAFVGSGGGAFRQGQGRWAGGYNVEFIAGFPQKIAGWTQAASGTIGIPRAVRPWRDLDGNVRVGIGTETHLYFMQSGVLTDITPLRTISSGTLTNAITTTASSNIVAIADNAQTLQNGDWVYLSAATSVGGLTINGWYPVSSRSGTGYNITTPTAAASSAGPLGGSIAFQYPRVTLTNPFATQNGSPTVTVTHASHGALAGNYVSYSGATAVAGLTLNGEYEIQSVIDANTYTITAGASANATTSGGGSVSVIYDIQVQQNSFTQGVGWGQGTWGAGAWGEGLVATPVLANGWTLDAYGQQLLAAPIGGTIYVWNPTYGGRAYPLLNAPASMNAMFVTPERFVVALGIAGNGLEMAWCDQNDYTVWTTTATNTANSGRTLIGGSYFTGGIAVRDGVSLVFSDRCCFQMNYTGNNEVYDTPQIGDNCGLVDPTAVCAEGGSAYWMSDQDWFQWNGGVSALPSDDVRASVFQGGINRQYLNKCTAMLNRAKRQVRFFYPSPTATENDSGMIYQYDQQCFAPLKFGRSCGADADLLQVPVSADTSGMIYYDETGTDANGVALPAYIELGDMDIANGERNADIFGFVDDWESIVGNVSLTVLTKYYPDQTPTVDGPYTLPSGSRQDLRSDGKMFAFGLLSDALGASFRLGVPRLDVQPSGARR